jgi:hypothetical protein
LTLLLLRLSLVFLLLRLTAAALLVMASLRIG